MAYITSHHAPAANVFHVVARGTKALFRSIGNGFVAIMEAKSRSHQIARLSEMSDRQLADIGLRREDIVRHVFSDSYYY